jgi:hypothetical protein
MKKPRGRGGPPPEPEQLPRPEAVSGSNPPAGFATPPAGFAAPPADGGLSIE